MVEEQSKDVDEVPVVLVDDAAATAADPRADELGEASFPASDPPSSWTWDVARTTSGIREPLTVRALACGVT